MCCDSLASWLKQGLSSREVGLLTVQVATSSIFRPSYLVVARTIQTGHMLVNPVCVPVCVLLVHLTRVIYDMPYPAIRWITSLMR